MCRLTALRLGVEVLGEFSKIPNALERVAFIRRCRGGGSMSHEVYHALQSRARKGEEPIAATAVGAGGECDSSSDGHSRCHQTSDERCFSGDGQLVLREETEVSCAEWRPASSAGEAMLQSEEAVAEAFDGEIVVRLWNENLSTEQEAKVDFVWMATGGELDLSLVPAFEQLIKQVNLSHDGVTVTLAGVAVAATIKGAAISDVAQVWQACCCCSCCCRP